MCRHDGPAPASDVTGEWYSLDQTFVMEPGKSRLPKPPIRIDRRSVRISGGPLERGALTSRRRGCSLCPMNAFSSRPLPARPLALPNLLTYGRIAAVPVVVGLMYWQSILGGGLWLRWLALAVFIAAGITDILDGYFARMWGQQSSLGRMLDPIADKLLVASCLLMLAADGTIRGWSLFAAVDHPVP